MAEEAEAQSMDLNHAMFEHLACGAPLIGGEHRYVAPDSDKPIHNSMSAAWRVLEYWPKNLKWKRFPDKSKRRGYYLPRAEPRRIEIDEFVHRSALDRLGSGYRPVNLPTAYRPVEHTSGKARVWGNYT
jgi:hypothetical protein